MIEELQRERENLYKKDSWFEALGQLSAIVMLIALGAMLGSLPNSDKKYLKFNTTIFGLCGVSLLISYRCYVGIENQLEINSHNLDKARSTKPNCYGCIYSSGNDLLPCTVHPTTQPINCADKRMGE